MRRIFALLVVFLSFHATAQIAGSIKGQVTDTRGAGLPGAQVVLLETATGIPHKTVTTHEGYFDFSQLVSGTYSVEADALGFNHAARSGITLQVGQTVSVTLVLPAGEMQAVNVTSDLPLLQALTSNIQMTIPGPTIVAIPLNSRNFVQLAQLAPGVALPPGTQLPRINGGRPRTNEYLFDGISALQPEPGQVAFFPILDDIAEFTIEANNVSAEFGRFNGGVVNVATRSGSNQWHGSVFEFLRNEDLNARNYFATTARKPMYRRNVFGGTLGGPVLHDKLFFFGDYQGIRQRLGVTRTSTVPTENMRNGIFTGVAHIYNPYSGTTNRTEFANDVIDPTVTPFDPTAVALLQRIPHPTNSAAANNYTRVALDDDHQNQFDVRVDGARGVKDRAFGRYTYYHEVESPATPFPDGSGAISGSVIGTGNVTGLSKILGQQAVFAETHTFTSHLLNDFHLGYTRRSNHITGPLLGDTASSALGIPGIPTNGAFQNALSLVTITGYQQIGASAGTYSEYQTGVWQVTDSVLWTVGQHSLKFGADIRTYQLNAIAPPNPTGAFGFTTTGTNQQSIANTGNAFASFLLGQVGTFSIDLQNSVIRPRDHIQEYFVQDDWRVTPKLTVNMGARWTLHSPSTEKTNQGAVFNLASQQLDYVGVNGNPRSARQLHWANVAPRVGFAYSVTPRTVIRSGFGIVFIDESGITTPFTVPQFPFIQSVQQNSTDNTVAAFQLKNGPTVTPIPFSADAGLGQSVYTVNKTAGSGYVEQWNLAVQRAITSNLSVEFAYVGSHIVHVGIPDSNLNQLTADQLAQGAALQQKVTNPYYNIIPASSPLGAPTITRAQLLKPYPRFQNVATYRNNSGTTNYNAFQTKVEKRFTQGLSFTVAYTHSKLIDDASSVFSSTVLSSPNSSSLVAADTYRPYLERDSSQGDMPNVTAVSAVYDLPAGRGHRLFSTGWTNVVLGGWRVNGIATLQSGMPVTVTRATNDLSFAGFVIQRPNMVASPTLPSGQRTPARFFNPAAFTVPNAFTIGNASRNPVRGPAYRDLDLALVKNTRIGEKTHVEFRAEMFDVTNTPAFSQPNGSFGSTAFGSISSTTTDPRVVQLALRLSR